MSALSITNLTVQYGAVTALEGLNLEIPEAQICGILGMNGSGKSTLFKSVMGLVKPATGEITVFEQPAGKARKSGWVGYVPQNEEIDLHFPLRVQDVVMMGRYGFQNSWRHIRNQDHEAVYQALATVDMAEYLQRPIGALSGGQRKRVFVARALSQGARIMILDEPFAGVDKDSELLIMDLLKKLAAQGTTILVSTHDLNSVPRFCAQVALVNQRVQFYGPAVEALKPENLIRAFSSAKLPVPSSIPSQEGK